MGHGDTVLTYAFYVPLWYMFKSSFHQTLAQNELSRVVDLRFHNRFIYVELTSVSTRYPQGGGVDISLSSLMYCAHVLVLVYFLVVSYIVLPAARSCAAWDDNNKDNVCEPNIPAGLKRPPPSKTISPIIRFETILDTLSEWIPRRPTGRSSVIKPGTL